MNRKELEKHLKSQNIETVIRNLLLNIHLLAPDGAIVHKKNLIGATLDCYLAISKFRKSQQETFIQLKHRAPAHYRAIVGSIYEAHTELRVAL